jgi:endogenous inhibitor of DNA gyrase (YacG/DUF329 family)
VVVGEKESDMARVTCPACRQAFESDASRSMPFCSERCRLIDLGRWFEEQYSMPVERDRELEEFKDQDDAPENGNGHED